VNEKFRAIFSGSSQKGKLSRKTKGKSKNQFSTNQADNRFSIFA